MTDYTENENSVVIELIIPEEITFRGLKDVQQYYESLFDNYMNEFHEDKDFEFVIILKREEE